MMRKILSALLCAALLTSCLKSHDDDFAWATGPFDTASPDGMSKDSEFNGEFALSWTVDGQRVGTSTLQVWMTANILSLPCDWLHQQLFPGQEVRLLGDDIVRIWAMHLAMSGYSDDNYYFKIQNTTYQQTVEVGGRQLTYEVCFTPERSTTFYNKVSDSWTGIAPIDSIVVRDEDNRTDHHPTLVGVKRFSPAATLSFSTTSRTEN